MTNREIVESPLYQGIDEKISYTLDTTPWGSSPTFLETKIYNMSTGTKIDVSSTNLSGSTVANGNIISTPAIQDLITRISYRLEIKFIISGNTFEAFAIIIGEE